MSYQAKITSKGQITLPAELRARLQVKDGDTVEFYLDHLDRVCVRPRREGSQAFLDALPKHKPKPAYSTDDDAIAAAIIGRDSKTRSSKARNR